MWKKTFCNIELQIWLEMITSSVIGAKRACFKGSRTSCGVTSSGVFSRIWGQKRWHHMMDVFAGMYFFEGVLARGASKVRRKTSSIFFYWLAPWLSSHIGHGLSGIPVITLTIALHPSPSVCRTTIADPPFLAFCCFFPFVILLSFRAG